MGSSLASTLSIPFIDGDDLHPDSNVDKMSRGEALGDEDREPWLKLIRKKALDLNQKQSQSQRRGDESDPSNDNQDQSRKPYEKNGNHKQNLAEVFETSHLQSESNLKDGAHHAEIAEELGSKTLTSHVEELSNTKADPILKPSSSTPITKEDPKSFQNISGKHRTGCVIACSALKESYRSLLRGDVDSLHPSDSSTGSSGASKSDLRVVHLYLRLPPSLLLHRMHLRKGHFMKEGMLKSQLETLQEPKEGGKEDDIIVIEAVQGGEWREDAQGNEDGREKSKEELNEEAVKRITDLLGW